MLQPQAQAGMPRQQDGNSATSGVQQRPRASNAGLQNYGPYRQRKRVPKPVFRIAHVADETFRLYFASMAQATSSQVSRRRYRKRVGDDNDFLRGTSSDSNILKIFRMLDRDNGDKVRCC